jgi:hypothetical protein
MAPKRDRKQAYMQERMQQSVWRARLRSKALKGGGLMPCSAVGSKENGKTGLGIEEKAV